MDRRTRTSSEGLSDTSSNNSPREEAPFSSFSSARDLEEITTAAKNIALAHEIAVNNNFRIQENEQSESNATSNSSSPKRNVHDMIKQEMEKAFWDKLREDLDDYPPNFDHAFVLLEEIKHSLLKLLPYQRKTSIHTQIEETLDMSLLRQQAENETLDIRNVSAFVIDTMASICAPVRDNDVAALRGITDVPDLFKGMYKVIKIMSKDMANMYIASFRPIIQEHQVDYQRRNFSIIVDKLPNALKNTEVWLKEARDEISVLMANSPGTSTPASGSGAQSSSKDISPPGSKVGPYSVLKTAYLSLLEYDHHGQDGFPETLSNDRNRFLLIQQQYKRLVLVASVLIASLTSIRIDIKEHSELVSSLKEQLLILSATESIQKHKLPVLMKSFADFIKAKVLEYGKDKPSFNHCIQILSVTKGDILQEQLEKLNDPQSHPLHQLLNKRCKEYIGGVADAVQKQTQLTEQSVAVPSGLTLIGKELKDTAKFYSKLVNLNLIVYGPFYAPILKGILDKQ